MNVVVLVGIVITLATGIPVFLQMRNHPRGLKVLFFAEMWERFSYYGMRAILIFYLTQHFLFDDAFATSQYGSYTSMVFLLPLIGGVLADRYIGTRKAIAYGALLLVAGHFLMAAEGAPARQFLVYEDQNYEIQITRNAGITESNLIVDGVPYEYEIAENGIGISVQGLPAGSPLPQIIPNDEIETAEVRNGFYVGLFYLALSLIIMGVGFLKPNISTIVGQLYPQGDPRRDPGFTLYYYGINMGAFWASILCGLLGQTVGWWAGFGLAGVGMLAGYIVFVRGKEALEGHGEPPDPEKLAQPVLGPLNQEHLVYLGGLLGVGFIWFIVQHSQAVGTLLSAGSIIILGYVAWFLITKCDKIERERMLTALILISGSVVFWTLFEQAGSSMNLFAERNTQLPNQGYLTVTAGQTQSFNAGFILLFAPVFSLLWVKLGQYSRDPDPFIKFGLALVQIGLGFMLLVWSAQFADENFRIPLIFLVLAYLLHTTGELCLSPVGLSQMTKLSVPALLSTTMAIWFLSSSWALYLGGFVAQMAGTETVGGQVLNPQLALETSMGVFNWIGWTGLGSGMVFFALSPILRHWTHEIHLLPGDPTPKAMAPDTGTVIKK